jgi:cell division protein FtsL
VNSDVNKLRDDIDKKKQQIADDDKAISDLEHQCQEEGCPPGWLR